MRSANGMFEALGASGLPSRTIYLVKYECRQPAVNLNWYMTSQMYDQLVLNLEPLGLY